MRKPVPFVGGSNTVRSVNAHCEQTLNCYVELDNGNPRAPVALYGTPGLRPIANMVSGVNRGAIEAGGSVYIVIGDTLYQLLSDLSVTTISTFGTSSGAVSMAVSKTHLLLVDGSAGYVMNLEGVQVLRTIIDVDFPNGVTQAAYIDGYFIVSAKANSPAFWISDAVSDSMTVDFLDMESGSSMLLESGSGLLIGDGAAWNGLDFGLASANPDAVIGMAVNHRELWLFGPSSIEVWLDTGNPTFPFERSNAAYIEYGCDSGWSIARLDNTLFWLGGDANGRRMVWRANGYTPQRISTHAVEFAMAGYSTVADAYALAYQQEGHSFYVLSFPTADKTWVYDVSTQLWHERAKRNPSTGALTRWPAAFHAMLNGISIVGDISSGYVYKLDMGYYFDGTSDPILRRRTTQTMSQDQSRLFFHLLQVDMETGVGNSDIAIPQLMLQYSNDGGHTWSNEATAPLESAGATGEYGKRVRFRRLGSGRNRVWRISFTDPAKFAVFGAFVDATAGTS